jgi:hypothetical protein
MSQWRDTETAAQTARDLFEREMREQGCPYRWEDLLDWQKRSWQLEADARAINSQDDL